jgi:hypothetical protein
MTKLLTNITQSKFKAPLKCYEKTLENALNFGFSFLEQEDHIVEYVVTNAKTMKKIFGEIPESVLKPDGETIGLLWTSKLLLSDKLADSHIIFSNSSYSIVIDIDLNSDEEEMIYEV